MTEGVGANGLMAALAGSSLYVSLLPPLSEVRRAETDSATARDVRHGVAMASVALVGTGVILGVAARTVAPVGFTLAMAALMGGIYEMTLRRASEAPPAVDPAAAPRRRWT